MFKKLDFMKECFIRSYNHHAFALGILQTYDNDKVMDFIKTNYIQLVWYEHNDKYSGHELNFNINFFKYWDNFEREYISNNLLAKNNVNIIKYMENAIIENKYLYLCLDEFYIPDRWAYNNTHFYHDVLVYGFDSERNLFYLCGYDENMKFNFSECSYTNMIEASPEHIELLSINKDYNYKINYDIMKYNIDGFINCNDFQEFNSKFHNDERIYGFAAIYKMIEYLSQIITTSSRCNLIPFTIYLEHLMVIESIIYSLEMIEYYSKINSVIDAMKVTINLLIKYNVCFKTDIILRAKGIIEDCIYDEHPILTSIISKIELFE